MAKYNTVGEIDQRICDLSTEIDELEKQRKELMEMDPVRRMATEMHSLFCKHNHMEVCDWYYGSWERPTHAHNEWYKKAHDAIVQGLTREEMKRVSNIVRG